MTLPYFFLTASDVSLYKVAPGSNLIEPSNYIWTGSLTLIGDEAVERDFGLKPLDYIKARIELFNSSSAGRVTWAKIWYNPPSYHELDVLLANNGQDTVQRIGTSKCFKVIAQLPESDYLPLREGQTPNVQVALGLKFGTVKDANRFQGGLNSYTKMYEEYEDDYETNLRAKKQVYPPVDDVNRSKIDDGEETYDTETDEDFGEFVAS